MLCSFQLTNPRTFYSQFSLNGNGGNCSTGNCSTASRGRCRVCSDELHSSHSYLADESEVNALRKASSGRSLSSCVEEYMPPLPKTTSMFPTRVMVSITSSFCQCVRLCPAYTILIHGFHRFFLPSLAKEYVLLFFF